jgi:hypothetical protein
MDEGVSISIQAAAPSHMSRPYCLEFAVPDHARHTFTRR